MVKSRFFDLEGRFNRLAGLLRDQEDMDAELWRRWNARFDSLIEKYAMQYPNEIPPLVRFGEGYRLEMVWPKRPKVIE